MKKFLLALFICCVCSYSYGQVTDNFDGNKLGWTEFVSDNGQAIVKDGKMHLESSISIKRDDSKPVMTHCYAPFDFNKDFQFKCKAYAKKIDENNTFGIAIDYKDDYNYTSFYITEKYVYFQRVKEGKVVGHFYQYLKLKDKKKATLDLEIKSTFQRIEFYVNNMKVAEVRYLKLESTGIGFFVLGKMNVDFDDIEIIQ